MTTDTVQQPTSEFVEATLKYLADDKDPAVYIASRGGGDVTEHKGNYIAQQVAVCNGRLRGPEFSLDREGFALIFQASAVDDFYDNDKIRDIYEAEVKTLVQNTTGAARVEIFDHTHRAASLEVQKARMIREPAAIIHNDYTARSGPKRLREHFSDNPNEAEALLERRFAIINVWRSIHGTVHNAPLAFCDAASVAAEDLVSVERQARERIGEIQLALFSPAHRWYYFPQMGPDEVLLFKTYDSETDGRARFTLHTSFEEPNTAADAPPRDGESPFE